MDPRTEIKAVITSLESLRASLQDEQRNSEDAHADWENNESEDKEDEPDVIDNDEEADRLDRAINFLEKAVDELDAD